MAKPTVDVARRDLRQRLVAGVVDLGERPGGPRPQQRLELAPSFLDRVQVGTVRRQEPRDGPPALRSRGGLPTGRGLSGCPSRPRPPGTNSGARNRSTQNRKVGLRNEPRSACAARIRPRRTAATRLAFFQLPGTRPTARVPRKLRAWVRASLVVIAVSSRNTSRSAPNRRAARRQSWRRLTTSGRSRSMARSDFFCATAPAGPARCG